MSRDSEQHVLIACARLRNHKDPRGLVEMVSPLRLASVGTDLALWASDEAGRSYYLASSDMKERRA